MTFVRLFFAIVVLGLAGCASLPSATESNGGILAFPMYPDNNTGRPYSFYYGFKVFEQDTDIEVMEIDVRMSSGDYVDTYGPLPAGNYYLGTFQNKVVREDDMRYRFDDRLAPINIPFTIEEDTITVLEAMMWVQIRVAEGSKGWTASQDLVELTPAVEAKVMEELESKNDGLGWSISFQ